MMSGYGKLNSNGNQNLPPIQDPSPEKDVVTSLTRRVIVQGMALLRQQLERRVKQEPDKYERVYVDRLMRQLEAVSEDIQSDIIYRLKSRLFELIQQEVLPVMEDALNDNPGGFNGSAGYQNVSKPPSGLYREFCPA